MEVVTLREFIKKQGRPGDPASYAIKYNGGLFSGMVSGDEYDIWNKDGSKKVYGWQGKLDISQKKLRAMMTWVKCGISVCSKCHKPILGKEEQWFAGTYCEDCWTEDMARERNWDYSHLD